jgi:hypothetical protein
MTPKMSPVPAHVVDSHDTQRAHDDGRHQNLKSDHCRPCRKAPPVEIRPLVAMALC